jgi:hypothetical protein
VRNILIVLGAAGGFTAEEFIWFGEDQILPNFIKQKHTMNIMNHESSLSVLLHKKTVSVSQL